LTQLEFWYDVVISGWQSSRHFMQKGVAIWWVHIQHVPITYAAVSSDL